LKKQPPELECPNPRSDGDPEEEEADPKEILSTEQLPLLL
jgi:hypothetical protein